MEQWRVPEGDRSGHNQGQAKRRHRDQGGRSKLSRPVEGRHWLLSLCVDGQEYKNVKLDKITSLKPVFAKDGSITAANASTLSDGASALVLASQEKVDELGLKPLAKIICAPLTLVLQPSYKCSL